MSAKQIEEIIEVENNKLRIGKVVFYGICDFCHRIIDISNKLEFNQKKDLVNNFGVEKVDNKWVCKHKVTLPNCPYCQNLPF